VVGSATMLALSLEDVARSERSEALTSRLRDAVRGGSLPPGTGLPPSRSLAADLGVSRGVVVRAYERLTAEGYLVAVQGRGTMVADLGHVHAGRRMRMRPGPVTNPGLPSGALFPRQAWVRAIEAALASMPDGEFGYGGPEGHPRLRRALSGYLGRVRGLVAPPDRVLVVNGFAQTSRLVADVLVARGVRRIGVEDPGSAGLRDQVERAGLTCVGIPVDADGIDVDALARSGVRAVVVTPAHQFPTGAVLAADRRHELIAWARESGGLIVEDDYDAEFRYDRAPVGAMQGLGPDVVLYGGSVSKTLAPGLRLGWIVAPEAWIGAFVDAKYAADLATSVVDQVALAELIVSGDFERHLRRAAAVYRDRRDRLVTAVAAELPGWQVEGASAGLHVVLRPPPGSGCDEATMLAAGSAAGLDARALRGFALDTQPPAGLVLGYGMQAAASLERSISKFAVSLR
jgi:GntR family transcriptional regulator / MocR family aminotransferase